MKKSPKRANWPEYISLVERNGWNEDLWRLDIRDMIQSQFDVGII